jgi:hypothetical protein
MDSQRLLVVVLSVGLLVCVCMVLFDHVYYMYHPKLEITCENNWSVNLPTIKVPYESVLVHNNIQASHSYTEQISNRDTLTCVRATLF